MAQDYMRRAYKAAEAMEAIALIDDYVRVITHGGTHYRKVIYYEFIPPFQWIDIIVANGLANLPATTTAAKANVTNLDLYEDEFGQWRFFPLDNLQVQLFNPAAVPKWQLRNIQVGIDRNIIYRDPLLVSTEFCTWEDERPAVTVMNFSSYALGAARLVGWGYRYHCTDKFDPDNKQKNAQILDGLQMGTIPSTPIPCAGYVGETARG